MIIRLAPRTNFLSWKSLHISTAKHKIHLYASDSQICRPVQKAKAPTLLAQCVSLQNSINKPRTLVALTWMPFRTQKSLISTWVTTQHQSFSSPSSVLAGKQAIFSVTPVPVYVSSQSCTQRAKHGESCLCLRTARSPSFFWVRTRVCFLLTGIDKFTWRPIRANSALYSGMLRSNGMAIQFLAIQKVHGCILVTSAARCFCRKPF